MSENTFSANVKANVCKVIKGKNEEIELVLAAMLAGGHILLEDVPGTGKTVLAKAIARSISGSFSRIQFTPDLLPSDVTGINFFNMKKQEFELRKGAIFTNLLLADEINRATPRTQSALLECMEERQATIDGETYPLPQTFTVIATENPIEIQGTFPLPEAQLDRFLIRLSLGYASPEAELEVLEKVGQSHPIDALESVTTTDDLIAASAIADKVTVSHAVGEYIVALGNATRKNDKIRLGISTRGILALKKVAQGLAAVHGNSFVTPQDVKAVAPYVMGHRLVLREYGLDKSAAVLSVVNDILSSVEVPVEEA